MARRLGVWRVGSAAAPTSASDRVVCCGAMMATLDVPVLIIGGGPVGLSASLLLSRHGIRSLLVERHPGTTIHPKARALNVRTMELFRTWGIEADVRARALAFDAAPDVVWMTTLVGEETRRVPFGGAADRDPTDSPTTSLACMQYELEPILLEAARSYRDAELRFGHELADLARDGEGATATITEQNTGRKTSVRARFVVAADGASSPMRERLGIGMVGPGVLAHMVGIYFRADLADVGRRRPALLYLIERPEARGTMAAVDLRERWMFMKSFRADRDERLEDFTAARCIELVRKAVGIDDLPVEILSVLPWQIAAATAERFRDGCVMLAGDAAHLFGVGIQAMNVGIADAHNLAWKLAAVIDGWAGMRLIDTYDTERRTVALSLSEQGVLNMASGGMGVRTEHFSTRGMVLGASYSSTAVIPDGTELPASANPQTEYIPTARPGSRAPHAWLERGGRRLSTIDLFDGRCVLLTGQDGAPWMPAAARVRSRSGIPLEGYVVGSHGDLIDHAGSWRDLYGVGSDGAVLVRPDGYVAWRAQHAPVDTDSALRAALDRILSR